MSTLNTVSMAVANDMARSSGQQTAPAPGTFIQIIEQIIQALLPMLAGCIPALTEQTKAINRPSVVYKVELYRMVKQNTAKTDPRAVIYQSLLNVGASLNVEQVTSMQAGT